jgi:hypothetical protein
VEVNIIAQMVDFAIIITELVYAFVKLDIMDLIVMVILVVMLEVQMLALMLELAFQQPEFVNVLQDILGQLVQQVVYIFVVF